MIRAIFIACPIALAAVAGCNDCDFFERCKGNTRQICGGGRDQQVGRKIRNFPCPEAAECVHKGKQAACVASPAQQCDPQTELETCDGDAVRRCVEVGFVQRIDCSTIGASCEVHNGRATCTELSSELDWAFE